MKDLHIIQIPEYNYDFALITDKIQSHFDRILSLLNISTPSGSPTRIKLKLDGADPKNVSARGERVSKDPPEYEITINAGITYNLWGWSRVLASEYKLLPWIEQRRINDERATKLVKKELLADYAFFIGSYCIILHEISHVLLGHLDYIADELGGNKIQYSPEEVRIRKAFEADADRQAGELLLVFFEESLRGNGLGNLSFPSRLHAYEFYVYALVIVFRLVQDFTRRQGSIYPKPNERLYTIIGSLSKYFSHYLPGEHDRMYIHVVKSCLEAGEKFLVVDSYDPQAVMQNALNLAFADDVIRETNIRSYQHKVESSALK